MTPIASKSARAASLDVAESVRAVLDGVRAAGRTALTAPEAKVLCDAYGIPLPKEGLATSADQAARLANSIGYPVAMKIVSAEILRKSDAGCVVLGVKSDSEARAAFERIVGNAYRHAGEAIIAGVQIQQMLPSGAVDARISAESDPSFGKLVAFGLGGALGDVLGDRTFHLAPVSHEQALGMVSSIRAQELLDGLRGSPPVNREELADLLVNVSALIGDCPDILRIDLDPVFAAEHFATAVDARIVCDFRPRGERGRRDVAATNSSVDLRVSAGAAKLPAGASGGRGAAFSSRSGAVATSIIGFARSTGMAVSAVVGLDDASEIDEADLLAFFGQEPAASVIAIQCEELLNGRAFVEVASRVSKTKPVLVLKAGRRASDAVADRAETDARDKIYDDLLRAAGVIRSRSLRSMLDCARGLPALPTPKGENVLVISASSGLGALLSDACLDSGLTLMEAPKGLGAELEGLALREDAGESPVEVAEPSPSESYREAVQSALADEAVHALVLGWGQTAASPLAFADQLIELVAGMRAKGVDKPIVAWLAGEAEVEAACEKLYGHGVVARPCTAETPVEVLGAKYQWARGAGLVMA
ncbi:acetate--CoA ligase family protein [Chenggangzhangella methanolivorans]|uniref:acetate--CoA ligase family protein n=1 Tax=Chenggangzhangella methanolivorans TaxID=1437009 RepID=UPI0021BD81B8|nr:acetate--CoA ligase family protein [Chenggangzhangella methanolivorans]